MRDAPLLFVVKVFLVFRSLIRTFDLSVEGTPARKNKRKRDFLLYFARLIVSLQDVILNF